MQKLLFLFFLFLLFGINHVNAESTSLKQQLENNTPIDEIECKNKIHILIERPNGKLACVFENTADKLNWFKINQDMDMPHIFEIQFNDVLYELEYVIEGGVVKDFMINSENDLFTIHIDSFKEGNLKMQLSNEFLDILKPNSNEIFLLRSNGETSVSMLSAQDPNKTEVIIYFTQGNIVIEFQKEEVILK